jgi:hypothetical protein
MPTVDEILEWIIVLFILSAFVLMVYHRVNPKNRLSRGLEAFWNAPGITQTRREIWRGFWFIVLLVVGGYGIEYYFNESSWYPREREVEVFFKAHQWIDGEIQTCYSVQSTTPKTPDAEVTIISCSYEQNESHVLKVKFWGPIKADKKKVWKCERSQSAMTCSLQ